MSCNDKPKCCEVPQKQKCPPPPPCCPKVPDTATFKCPENNCPAPKPYCPEQKDDKCTCVGKCPQQEKKC